VLIFQNFSGERVDCECVSGIFLDSRDAENFPFRDFFRAKQFVRLFYFRHFQIDILLDTAFHKKRKQACDRLSFSFLWGSLIAALPRRIACNFS